jgi:hypothetical protein
MSEITTISRPQKSSSRIFSKVTSNLYVQSPIPETASPDEQAANFLISLGRHGLRKMQMLFGQNLSPQQQIIRLLIHHRLGLEAELIGQWQQADFYWQQIVNQIKGLVKQESVWQVLANDISEDYPGSVTLNTSIGLRQRIVEEVFIDTHCGFFNSLNALVEKTDNRQEKLIQIDGRNRSFVHTAFIEQLLPYSSLHKKDWLGLVDASWQQQIDQCCASKDWEKATRLCKHRLKLYPNAPTYQTELTEVIGSKVLSDLQSEKSKKQPAIRIRCLKKGLLQFELLVKIYPRSLAAYDYLGNLYHLYAIELAKNQQVSEGLVAVEKAIAYAPSLEAAYTTRDCFTQAMKQLQAQVDQMLTELRRRPNTHLNAQGIKLNRQAKRGFRLRDKYLASSQGTAIEQALKIAQATQVWQRIPELPPEPTDRTISALSECLTRIICRPPLDKAGLSDEWVNISRLDSDLASLPVNPICDFLEQVIWKKQRITAIITPPPTSEAPLIPVPTRPVQQFASEPFLPWLVSRQNVWLKVQAALSVIVLLLAISLGGYEYSVRTARAHAYEEISDAVQQNHLLGVVEGSEAFLSHQPLSGRDNREAEVKALYAEALTALFMQQAYIVEGSEIQRYIQRYRELMP